MSMSSEDEYEGISQYPYYCAKCKIWHTDDCSVIWCYKCKKDHKYEDACIFHPPQLHQHQEDSSASMAERRNIMKDIQVCTKFLSVVTQVPQEDSAIGMEYVREMMERIKKRVEKLSATGESSIQEPQEEPLPHDIEPQIEPPSSSPQEDDSDEPHWLPAVREMQKIFCAKMEQERDSAPQATAVEEEIHEPSEDCSVQEPWVDSAIYEDSDSDSDWGGPVCPRWEDLPYCEPRPQAPSHPWHEWEDTDIGSLWCADDDEAGETLVLSAIEVKAPTLINDEFSISYVTQVCDELEQLLYGDSYGEERDEQLPISCSMGDSIDDPYAIVKELVINKCGGVDKLHALIEEHLAPKRYYWNEFMEQDAFEPSGTWWKLIKKINCKMKRVSFYNSPPSAQHRGAREVLEKRWWKKKKWRDKASPTILCG